eukprot:m.24807 g.24807  ORF g.24807 m.24807 type:complete len:70 (+) comp9747_c0_seq1:9-218(+)
MNEWINEDFESAIAKRKKAGTKSYNTSMVVPHIISNKITNISNHNWGKINYNASTSSREEHKQRKMVST